MNDLRSNREALGISQSRLARLAGVSRFKICVFELGNGKLTADEESKLRGALRAEADRLRSVASTIKFEQATSGGQAA